MERGHEELHAPVHLDLEAERLWRGGEAQHLRPKSFAVLRALLARPGQVVTKDTLLQVVWPDTAVSDGVLTVCINELRRALGDSAQKPQYLETVPRRGYRWIGPLLSAPPSILGAPTRASEPPPAGRPVGRDALLAQLHARLAQVQKGTRQLLLLRGEAGLGKTTVVDTWLAQIAAVPGLWQGRGQCLAAASEAYFPVLEALGQLGRGTDQLPLVTTLTRHGPHWLGQLPSLLDPATLDIVQRRTQGATPARMLREGVEVLEALSAERLVVLVLEDLHWSDHATLALLESLAQRRTSAHLLLLGTYRPEARNASEGPLATLLLALQLQGAVLPLEALTLEDVTAYLAGRGGTVPAGLAAALHRRTDGHPLFLASVVDTLVQQGTLRQEAGHWELAQPLAVVETVVPETLRQLILHQYSLLPPQEQTVVAAASVVGPEGAFAALAAGLAADVEAVEACGVALQRQGHILRSAGETIWPDGTVTTCYSFRHALYQHVIYAQVPLAQRQRLHQRLGARLEVAYGTQVRAHAAELVRHFTCGGDRAGAVRYGQVAAATALLRGAYDEAMAALRQGLAALQTLPETPARDQQELAYLLTLGPALIATQGVVAPAVQQIYTRAQVLSAAVGTREQQYHALDGLRQHAEASMAVASALPLAKAGLALARELADPALLGQAHAGLGSVLYYQGALPRAQAHLAQGLQALDAAVWVESKAAVTCRCLAAMCSWLLGYPDQACSTVQQALAQAEALADPATFGWALIHATYVSYLRGDVATMQTHTAALEAHATAHGLAVCAPIAAGFRGWLAVQQRQDTAGLESIEQALAAYQTSGRRAGRLLMAILLAEGYGQVGQPAAGLAVLAPLAGRFPMEAERYRLQGVLLAAIGQAAVAEDCLHQALTLARRQRALSLQLRVVLALARLAPTPERRASAQQQLAEVYGRFTEGFDTADLQTARACLDAAPLAAMEERRSHTRRHGLLSVKIGV